MAEKEPKCVLCGSDEGKIIIFVEKTLKKSKEFLPIRKKFNLKYGSAKLPENVNTTDGYHRECYSGFTALLPRYRNSSPDESINIKKKKLKAESVCFYCEKNQQSADDRQEIYHSSNNAKIYEKITEWMTILKNDKLLKKINCLKSASGTVFYHHFCELRYFNNYRKVIAETPNPSLQIHKSIFNKIVLIIEEEVVKKKCPLLLSFLCDWYNYKLSHELKLKSESDARLMTNFEFKEKIVKHFKKTIKILNNDKKNVIVHPDCNSLEDDDFIKLEEMDIIDKAALILRKTILEINSDCLIPEKLDEFFKVLIKGRDFCRKDITLDNLSNSMASDLIFCVSNNAVIPSKHVTLGKTVKNLSNSREIIDTLNKLGHCCDYETLEKFETEDNVSSLQSSRVDSSDKEELNEEEMLLDAEEIDRDIIIDCDSWDEFDGKNIIVESENFNESPPMKKRRISGEIFVLD